ncbi:MAG TPA: DUF488 family protein [Chromatiales bacterium]|mgnify:CR=1 FL=1|nr:DUF488 family protein [Chromatiales bacterium]
MSIRIKRVYDPPSPGDGPRILVDRLWPRGISREKARIDHWIKEVAPSHDLRRWYGHEPHKWPEFRKRYFVELDANSEAIDALRAAMPKGKATFLFSSKETELNNATALREYLQRD